MNAAEMMETCPDVETLAAFSDGALDEKTRLEVMQHVADCGQCQDDLVDLDAAKRELGLDPANVTPGPFRGRWIAPLAAAAAIVVVLFGVPSIRESLFGKRGMDALVEAADSMPERTTPARLSGDFAYKKHSPKRGNGDEERAEYAVDSAAWRAAERAEKSPSPANLQAAGVGHILRKDRDAAVVALQSAASASPESAPIQTDLAAAYLARGARGDYELALTAAMKSWTMEPTPAAAWNIAVALEYQQREPEAIAAWQKYLQLDGNSPWTVEARNHLRDLQER